MVTSHFSMAHLLLHNHLSDTMLKNLRKIFNLANPSLPSISRETLCVVSIAALYTMKVTSGGKMLKSRLHAPVVKGSTMLVTVSRLCLKIVQSSKSP